jgi:hypothetical protein
MAVRLANVSGNALVGCQAKLAFQKAAQSEHPEAEVRRLQHSEHRCGVSGRMLYIAKAARLRVGAGGRWNG